MDPWPRTIKRKAKQGTFRRSFAPPSKTSKNLQKSFASTSKASMRTFKRSFAFLYKTSIRTFKQNLRPFNWDNYKDFGMLGL